MSVALTLFVRDFEAEIDAERLLEERQAASHTAAALALAATEARTDGHAAGLEEGLAQGRSEALATIEAQRLDVLLQLAKAIEELAADRSAHRQQLELEMAAFVAQVADRVFPELVRSMGQRRLDTEIGRIVRRAIGSASLEIRLSPTVAEEMAPELAALGEQSQQKIRIHPDPALEPSEVHAAWQNGRSQYSLPAICQSIQTLIQRAAQTPPPPDKAGQIHE